jgi:hypothetical protein
MKFLGIVICIALLSLSDVASASFSITYYDNYNNKTELWEGWGDSQPLYCWNNEYLVDVTSGKTETTSHYLTSIEVFDLRGGFESFDHPGAGDEDWNPLKSIGDDVSGMSPYHVFAATITGWVYFEEGDVLSLESDDDAYIFLDDNTDWKKEILSDPGIHPFGYETLTIPAELAGYHWMTVKFAERCNIHSGIQINLNDEPLQAVPEAAIKIKPETLNLKSRGIFTAFIGLPEGYDEEDIDINTVECEGAPALKGLMTDDGRLIVKFDREDLVGVSPGDSVEMFVTGKLIDGTPFIGSDTIRVIDKGK